MIEADDQLAARLQAEEQDNSPFDEKSRMLMEAQKGIQLMIQMLQNIDREDLETLWKLVKTKHGNTRPEEEYERVLWDGASSLFMQFQDFEMKENRIRVNWTVKLDEKIGWAADVIDLRELSHESAMGLVKKVLDLGYLFIEHWFRNQLGPSFYFKGGVEVLWEADKEDDESSTKGKREGKLANMGFSGMKRSEDIESRGKGRNKFFQSRKLKQVSETTRIYKNLRIEGIAFMYGMKRNSILAQTSKELPDHSPPTSGKSFGVLKLISYH
ncbi:hypothetical protein Tco_0872706 [Tanacetum coccineum]